MFYFGKDRAEALRRYQEQATELHTGPRHGKRQRDITLRGLANEFLGHQKGRVVSGEILHRQYYDQRNYLRKFAEFIKPDTRVRDIDYKTNLVKAKLSANTINNRIGAVKALFSWAIENEIIEKGPSLKAIKRVSPKKVNRQVFTPKEIEQLLKHANPQMTAMILRYLLHDLLQVAEERLQFGRRVSRAAQKIDEILGESPVFIDPLHVYPDEVDHVLDSLPPRTASAQPPHRL